MYKVFIFCLSVVISVNLQAAHAGVVPRMIVDAVHAQRAGYARGYTVGVEQGTGTGRDEYKNRVADRHQQRLPLSVTRDGLREVEVRRVRFNDSISHLRFDDAALIHFSLGFDAGFVNGWGIGHQAGYARAASV